MSTTRKTPKLRFPEFTDDWEQRKLGEITGKVIGGGTPKTCVSEYWDGDIPWIQSSNVQENEMFDFDIPKSITQEGLEKSAAKLVPENSIAVVTHVGVGKLVFVPFSYTTSQDFTSLSELKTDAQFTCYSLYQRIKNDLHIVQGSAIKGITKDDLLSKEIMVPEIQEQRKIGNYFRKLDNLITLHQRELDSLKKLKKSLLQKMFPKNGEKIPELRFPEFTGDWEQRKLKDISSFIRGSFPQPYTNPSFYDEKGNPFVQVADIGFDLKLNKDTKLHISKKAESKSRFVKKGTVIVAIQGSIETSIGRTAITQYDAFVDRTILIFDDYKIEVDKKYFAYIIQRLFEKEKEKAWGATISTITKDYISELSIVIPSITEQKKIGSYFEQLDNFITLHQRELDTLKKLKKGLLQNMFV